MQRWFERELKRLRKEASPLAFDDLSGWINVTRFEEAQLLGRSKNTVPKTWGSDFGLVAKGKRFQSCSRGRLNWPSERMID